MIQRANYFEVDNKVSNLHTPAARHQELRPTSTLFYQTPVEMSLSDNNKSLVSNNSSSTSSRGTNTTTSSNARAKPLTPSDALNANTSYTPRNRSSSNLSTNSSGSNNVGGSIRRFSFNKHPVTKTLRSQRKSSQISIISSFPSQKCNQISKDIDHSIFYSKYKGILKDKDEMSPNEYNYDEKIRAPVMSLASLSSKDKPATLKRFQSAPMIFKTKTNSSNNSSSTNTVDSLAAGKHTDFAGSYKPASYDLSSYMRKLSISQENGTDPFESTNYVYSMNKRQKSIISQNSSNVSPKRETLKKRIESEMLEPVKQIDEPAKLIDNYVPPVLRPIIPTDEEEMFQKKDSITNLNLSKHPVVDSEREPVFQSLFSALEESKLDPLSLSLYSPEKEETRYNSHIEPTHAHWKQNSESSKCDYPSCGAKFTFFKRKHHCRHCGGIFCSSCLQNMANLNLLAHFEKTDKFPIHMKYIKENLFPIMSNETVQSTITLRKTQSAKICCDSGYSKFCKVCPSCYHHWIGFLVSEEEYEGKISNGLHDLEDSSLSPHRKESISSSGAMADWNWSSF